MKDVRAFWSVEPDDEGFDPVKYPEIKPYIAQSHEDDELGLRYLSEWPESLAMTPSPRPRVRRRIRSTRPRRSSRREAGR